MSNEADLMTLIDFCKGMADRIRGWWSDPRSECRAIWDAHDMAHVILGGDRQRKDWMNARAFVGRDGFGHREGEREAGAADVEGRGGAW